MYVGHIAAYRRTRSPGRLAWSEGRRPSGAGLRTSDEPGELSKWLSRDDITINIVIRISIIIIHITTFLNTAHLWLQQQGLAHYMTAVPWSQPSAVTSKAPPMQRFPGRARRTLGRSRRSLDGPLIRLLRPGFIGPGRVLGQTIEKVIAWGWTMPYGYLKDSVSVT